MNAPEYNFFGYRMFSNITLNQVEAATAEFMYRGHEVAFSTYNNGGSKVVVLKGNAKVGEYGSVEAAVAAIDTIEAWHSNAADTTRFNPQARRMATPH